MGIAQGIFTDICNCVSPSGYYSFVFFFKVSSLEFSYTIPWTHWKLYTFILYQCSVPKEIESLVDEQIHVLGQKTKQNKIK